MNFPLTAERLRDVLHYEPETGVFRWVRAWPGIKTGAIAGSVSKRGYRDIHIDRRTYRSGRLVWLYVYGCWPVGQIDHKNTIKDDDRLENLRDVPLAINKQNLQRADRDSQTGFLGVSKNRDKFRAVIGVNKRSHHLGTFNTPEEAYAAYVKAKRALHPGGML